MARRPKRANQPAVVDRVLEAPESTVLDLLDNLLNKGVVANGDITLGVAGIDLIYLRLSVLLCAVDRIMPPESTATRRKSGRRRPKPLKQRA